MALEDWRGGPAGRRSRLAAAAASLLLFVAAACTATQDEEREVGTETFPIDAYCQVNVRGVGNVEAETDYLPHVIQCENGGADIEALKVQAVSARSYMYYKMETSGSVADGTGDQVYSCGRTPDPKHFEAVRATSGQVLRYSGVTVCAFYVAGADPSNRGTCRASSSDSDPTNTERYVTYNEGLSGGGVHQTTLGWVDPGNHRNRGCMSQWGSRCNEERGKGYRDILKFYYGADIGVETAAGPCVEGTCTPSAEVCNGKDDDCDDATDEDYAPHSCGEGACRRDSVCRGGEEGCTPGEPAADDAACNGIDDDCDGATDEDCAEGGGDDAERETQEPAEPGPGDTRAEDVADGAADGARHDADADGQPPQWIGIDGLESGCACSVAVR